jgi:uncharacterized protein (TIGR02284 family)
MDTEKTISTLNGLIETLKDGEQGFRTAAQAAQDPLLKSLFQQYSRQRSEMTRELQSEVRRLGGDPENTGSMAGAAHRGWINIKSVVTGKDDASIVAEAERGEDSAKKMYEQALSEPLSPQTLALVREQAMKIHDAHDRVRALEKATSR